MQLQGSGGISYEWRPSAGLNNPGIPNPVATNSKDNISILKAFTPFGCESFDTIRIKIYDGPEIYVPAAFTPNGDGLNDLLRPIPAGLKIFKHFTVYNRLGEAVFSTTVANAGWNGFFKGKAQNSGVFTWIASGTGYAGNVITRQGTTMLIR
ncbi:MAG: gliding motility-associated C-terminal domain-containing protein [Ferruginibacter sp.]